MYTLLLGLDGEATIGGEQSLMLVGCSGNDPGPLGGTWKMAGPIPLTVTFRYGETESLGMIDKVSYKKEGNRCVCNLQSWICGRHNHTIYDNQPKYG